MLTVQDHLSLLSSQFLATSLQTGHPSYPTVTADPGPRNKKKTLQRRFGDQALRFFVNTAIQDAKEVRMQLHTQYVDSTIRARPPSRVLNLQPTDIAEEDTSLPRQYRSTLSQICFGHCSAHRIGISDTDTCPSCQQSSHDTPITVSGSTSPSN